MKNNANLSTYSKVGSLSDLESSILTDIQKRVENKESIEELKNQILGRKGLINDLFSNINDLASSLNVEKKEVGKTLNQIKTKAEEILENSNKTRLSKINKFDTTLDPLKEPIGKLNPISREKILTENIFMSMGFDVIDDTLVDTDFNVFESLNIPANHPARDMWDTFWTDSDYVLRTQTTAFQNHLLKEAKENNNFPIRAIQPGLCFRHEATDARHEHTFYQVDGFYVSKNSEKHVSIVDLISTLRTFFSIYFNREMNIRIQPAYFPFVEPGFEFAISCPFCNGEGCSVCSRSGWIEIGGTGMVHPNIFKFAGLNPEEYSGFAFGYGLDRMAQLKLDINDVRLFRSNDLRFLINS